ncbi:hypothetical protein DENIS_1153 [Desulfonema ishimotonii]|uniref:Right handed beta helix domain-containing protein n=1 Tax=Desulfonema ishimotonii TaxID=45657 RepID=A0A401FTA4_9BACT|nr:choice-of-anchor Q domain-containing protein [Desulfonema ishimotonii]GBC60202.1 hypothetical protein DENIS_1153 [Desulfonema ishimotonii]
MRKQFFIFLTILFLSCLWSTNVFSAVIYVKHDATGLNNGTSWTNAYKDLQDALTAAQNGNEIWVAKGVYRPVIISGRTPEISEREISFLIKDGVKIYGGFVGTEPGTEDSKEQRDLDTNITVLSGDIDMTGSDGIYDDNNQYNSYRVITVNNNAAEVVTTLNGVTISQGNGNHVSNEYGGGIYVYGNANNTVLIEKSRFINNYANSGGAIFIMEQKVNLKNCYFSGNLSGRGGCINTNDSEEVTVLECNFSGNRGASYGGVFYFDNSVVNIIGSSFSENSTDGVGGNIYIYSANVTLTNNVFYNSTAGNGGVLYSYNGTVNVTNCTLYNNKAKFYGGAVYTSYTDIDIISSTISENYCGNSESYSGQNKGGGIYLSNYSELDIVNTILSKNFFNNDLYNDDCARDDRSTINSMGNNIVGVAEPLTDFNEVITEPQLGSLADNGGPTKTMAICSGSPAKDAGASGDVGADIIIPNKDQRGSDRQPGKYDIGAYEGTFQVPDSPTTTSVISDNITANSATLGGKITASDIFLISSYGVVWSTQQNPEVSDSVAEADADTYNSDTGEFEAQLTGLEPNTQYYERAFIQYSDGCSGMFSLYGVEYSFTTKAEVPNVTWDESKKYCTATTAELFGNISNKSNNVSYYYRLGISDNFDSATSPHSLSVGSDNSFTIKETDLTPEKLYYVWVYAENNAGVPAYDTHHSFNTESQSDVPTLDIATEENITDTSVRLTGIIEDFGINESGLIEYGFVLSENEDFLPSIKKAESSSIDILGPFPMDVDGLTPYTTYYAKAYGINSKGTGNSTVISFQTKPNLPVVEMKSVEPDSRSATLNGNIDTLGLTNLVYGFVWDTSPSPELPNSSNHEVGITSSSLDFSWSAESLEPYTDYHAKAYGKNASGEITYSQDFSFKTLAESPDVETLDPVILPDNKVAFRAEIIKRGASAEKTEFGFYVSTASDPIIVDVPDSEANFSYVFDNLPGTKEQVKAYAKNDIDTDYGVLKSFGNIKGDINRDDVVDLSDAIITLKIMTGISVSSVALDADVNADGKIGIEEAAYILREIATP